MPNNDLVDRIYRAHRFEKTVLDIRNEEFAGVTWKSGSELPPVHLRFQQVQFNGDLTFRDIVFQAGVSFIDVDFRGVVSFAACQFKGPIYFWKCRFHQNADFSHIVVSCSNFTGSHLDTGETNFSYSTFLSTVRFRHSVFNGPAYFWRTVFACEVDFEVAQFKAAAQFMGRREDILVSERELPKDTAALLLSAQPEILYKCEDRSEGYYNFDTNITSKEELRKKLQMELAKPEYLYKYIDRRVRTALRDLSDAALRLPYMASSIERIIRRYRKRMEILARQSLLQKEDGEKIVELWRSYHDLYMFNNECHFAPNFMEVSFAPNSEFRHVSLRKCRFRRADLSNVRFASVVWERGSNSSRERIFDEVLMEDDIRKYSSAKHMSKEEGDWVYSESIAVSNLYHQLRLRADLAGERNLARNFYYGEMEMARQADPRTGKSFFPWMYKHLSGYGTRELRAAIILLILLLGVWPLFYMGLDVYSAVYRQHYCLEEAVDFQEIFTSEVTSLEAATFLLRPPLDASERTKYVRRFGESVERIMVSIQAGLFVLSLKSKFQRGSE